MRFVALASLTYLLIGFDSLHAQTAPRVGTDFSLLIQPGDKALSHVPLRVPLSLPPELTKSMAVQMSADDKVLDGQLIVPSLITREIAPADKGLVRLDLVFILPSLGTKAIKLQAKITGDSKANEQFHWVENASAGWTDLVLENKKADKARSILRYMHAAFDDSSPEKRNKTYKVFHHLFDPEGSRIVTNGGHTDPDVDPRKLLYPHHRGLMFAFNNVTYGNGKRADVWHCTGDAHQAHEKFLVMAAGPVAATQQAQIGWHGVKKEKFAQEQREMTVFHRAGGTLVEFTDRLLPVPPDATVKLDGDPQHAGFQFRASNDVEAKGNSRQTYYLRPDGQDKPGATRNWSPKDNKGFVNLPWNAMSFVLDGQRYTVCYLDHPRNPGEKRYSERDYGRFGCYFEYELTKDNPLVLNHRIWLQRGEMTGAQVQALADAFASPPRVEVK